MPSEILGEKLILQFIEFAPSNRKLRFLDQIIGSPFYDSINLLNVKSLTICCLDFYVFKMLTSVRAIKDIRMRKMMERDRVRTQ